MGPRAWTRGWTTTPRACGARTSSRASRRPWPSTRPAAGARSSCRTRARCTVRAAGTGHGRPPGPAPCSLPLTQPVGEVLGPGQAAGESGRAAWCLGPPQTSRAARSPHLTPPAPPLLRCRPGGFGVTQWAQETGSVQCPGLGEGPCLGGCGKEAWGRGPPDSSAQLLPGSGGRSRCDQGLCWEEDGRTGPFQFFRRPSPCPLRVFWPLLPSGCSRRQRGSCAAPPEGAPRAAFSGITGPLTLPPWSPPAAQPSNSLWLWRQAPSPSPNGRTLAMWEMAGLCLLPFHPRCRACP